jgi:aminoglycoside phosphotransferase (APT) family kinase protein
MSNFDHFVGTREVTGAHAFDIAALGAYLSDRLEGFQGPLKVQMFNGGQSNPTYKLITPRHAYVMRAKPGPVAKLLPSAHAVERGHRIYGALPGAQLPLSVAG